MLLKSERAMREATDQQRKLAGITGSAKGLHKTPVISEKVDKFGFISDFTFSGVSGKIKNFDIAHRETG